MADGTEFAGCPACKQHPLRVKATKFDTLFIACSGYPKCTNSMNMPKGIVKLEMLDQKCPKCRSSKKSDVFLFRVGLDKGSVNESMAEALPDDNNTSGVFCIFAGCDANFETLTLQTAGYRQ